MDITIENMYRERVRIFSRKLERVKRRGLLLSLARLLVFIAGLVLIYFTAGISLWLTFPIVVCTGGLFLFLVRSHGLSDQQVKYLAQLIILNRNERMAIQGEIGDFENGSEWISTDHPYSFDLDLFGEGSLFQLLNRTCSLDGKETLAAWLKHPAEGRDVIRSRQEAIRELGERLDWRQDFLATGKLHFESAEEKKTILDWIGQWPEFSNLRFLRVTRFLLPAATLGMLFLSIARIIPAPVPVLLILIQLLLLAFYLVPINRLHRQVSRRYEMLQKFGQLMSLIEKEKFTSQYLRDLQSRPISKQISTSDRLKHLAILIRRFDRRLDMLIGVILNGLLLWDLHCVISLEEWKKEARESLPHLFPVIGEMDALISLAGFHYNNPSFVFPEISGGSEILEVSGAGHPLIAGKDRVDNDFALSRPGSLVIITGPNMAGKSTFLRTIGVNLVLAMAGAPVCAKRFRFTPVLLFTSMRTSDSLRKNESYFHAELKRLKMLMEKLSRRETVFILLDEILKGTNTVDKHHGSELFIRQMIRMKGTGMIATHDVALGEMEKDFPEQISNRCFEIEIEEENIRFDYLLRKGISRNMNAVRLMKQMGIV